MGEAANMTTDGCVSSRLVPECEGEEACGFYGLPHVLCVPIPPYARRGAGEPPAELLTAGTIAEEVPAPQDELRRVAAKRHG